MQDKEFAAILQEEPMQPLALVPLTEEEQVCTSHTLTNAYLQMLNCLSPILWYLTLIQIQLTDVPVSSHSSHSSLLFFFFFFGSFNSLCRGTSPCLWTVWQCWGSWEKEWVVRPQLEWSVDEEPHGVVEVTAGKKSWMRDTGNKV